MLSTEYFCFFAYYEIHIFTAIYCIEKKTIFKLNLIQCCDSTWWYTISITIVFVFYFFFFGYLTYEISVRYVLYMHYDDNNNKKQWAYGSVKTTSLVIEKLCQIYKWWNLYNFDDYYLNMLLNSIQNCCLWPLFMCTLRCDIISYILIVSYSLSFKFALFSLSKKKKKLNEYKSCKAVQLCTKFSHYIFYIWIAKRWILF